MTNSIRSTVLNCSIFMPFVIVLYIRSLFIVDTIAENEESNLPLAIPSVKFDNEGIQNLYRKYIFTKNSQNCWSFRTCNCNQLQITIWFRYICCHLFKSRVSKFTFPTLSLRKFSVNQPSGPIQTISCDVHAVPKFCLFLRLQKSYYSNYGRLNVKSFN